MIVQTALAGSQTRHRQEIEGVEGTLSLDQLFERLVARELAAANARRAESALLQILTPAALALGVSSGRYGREPRAAGQLPSVETALHRALEAFDDGLFLVFIDGTQVLDRATVHSFRPDTELRLVRLVALTGALPC